MNIKQFMTKHKIGLILFGLFLLAFGFRVWFVWDNHVLFFWDQARDAFVSREILEEGDLKILGPSASGTKDMIYHGVYFYYFIGPLYTVFGGNPLAVSVAVALVNSVCVIVFFALGKFVFSSIRVGVIAALIYSVSAYSVLFGVWLSNPTFAPLLIALMYLAAWKGFFQFSFRWIPLCALALGLSIQSAVFTVYLGVVPLIGTLWVLWAKRATRDFWVWLISGIMLGTVSISSMIAGQYLLYRSGIFVPSDLPGSSKAIGIADFVQSTALSYGRVFQFSVMPAYFWVSVALGIITIIYVLFSQKFSQRFFILLYLSAPIVLLLIFFRRDTHTLVGISGLIFILLAYSLSAVSRVRGGVLLTVVILLIYSLAQIIFLQKQRNDHSHYFVIQQGASLNDQIAALDFIYEEARGRRFSISSITNPLGMNATWAYLFAWYSSSRDLPLPYWYGPTQAGIFGDGVLKEVASAEKLHFTIIEPLEGIPDHLVKKLVKDELVLLGEVDKEMSFGRLQIQVRE